MPIYEYQCARCGKTFEKLIMGSREQSSVCCDACGSCDVHRLVSTFSNARGQARSGESGSACAPRSSGFS